MVVFTVVVFVVLTGTSWLVVVVVVCDCSDACGATGSAAGTQIADPAVPRLPIKRLRAKYIAVVFIFFFTVSI